MSLSFFSRNRIGTAGSLPPYTLKVSPRAKYARLKMTPHEGLVVIVPVGFDKKQLPSLLQRYESWIKKSSEQLERHRPETLPSQNNGLPCTILFPHLSEEWRVIYHANGRRLVEVDEGAGKELLVGVDVSDTELCRGLLLLWLKRQAELTLIPAFENVATERGFDYQKAGVRLQHSRWGSCSSRRSITLNTKLLFLPDHLVRYIMIHELCHTVHMNHSKAFWALVQEHDPLWRTNNLEMKTAWKYVPQWVASHP